MAVAMPELLTVARVPYDLRVPVPEVGFEPTLTWILSRWPLPVGLLGRWRKGMRSAKRTPLVRHVLRPLAPVPVPQSLLALRVGVPVRRGSGAVRWGRRGLGDRLLVGGRGLGPTGAGCRRRRLGVRRR